jgi:hypothetical protein
MQRAIHLVLMEPITTYGKLSQHQLLDEMVGVVATLASRIRELAALQSDINRAWYPVYAREPASSVAAKERSAEYACLDLLNDKRDLEAEIDALTATRDLIQTILPYANP